MRAATLVLAVRIVTGVVVAATGVSPASRQGPGPLVSIWYRGSPAGTPRRQDLEAVRAHGLTGVTWPSRQTDGEPELSRLAAALDLHVTLRIAPVPLTAVSARTPDRAVDLAVTAAPPEDFAALVWRAVAHGAELVSYDPGVASGTGLEDSGGRPRAWVAPALTVAGQLAAHAQLIEGWHRVGPVAIEPPAPAALDLELLEDGRSWVLVATNASRGRVRAVAHLASGVPAALWSNLLDGSMLSMISQPAGARWSLDLEPGAARVYVVNR